ncbi:MAG TPA: hypothetical protein VGE66_07245 [Chitinophagaceae bacterium]
MRKVINATRLLAAAFCTSLLIISCQKDTTTEDLSAQEEEQASTATAESEAQSEAIFEDIFDNIMGVNAEVAIGGTGVFSGRTVSGLDAGGRMMDTYTVGCFTVTVDHLGGTAIYPIRVTTDFGTAGCTGRDGRTRYGKIITTYSGRMIIPGSSATTTFDGYRVGDISVSGTHTTINQSTSSERKFVVEVGNGKLSWPNGNYVQRTSRRVITQVEGLGTPLLPGDDVFTITGSASGTVKRDDRAMSWESVIQEPLRKRFSCHWIVKGTVKTIRRNQSSTSPWVGVLNYGTGTCDNKATLTINGVERQITLH